MEYDVLLFDADDTLFDFGKAMRTSLQGSMEALGLFFRTEYCTVYETLNGALWRQLEQGALTKEELKRRRMAEFFAEIGVTADAVRMQELYQQRLNGSAFLLPGAREALSALSAEKAAIL